MTLFRKIAAFAIINTASYSAVATEGGAFFDSSSEALRSRMARAHVEHDWPRGTSDTSGLTHEQSWASRSDVRGGAYPVVSLRFNGTEVPLDNLHRYRR